MKTRACRQCRKPFTPKATGRRQLYCSDACRSAARRRRKRTPAYFMSETPEWSTPQELFDALNQQYGFDLDVCATDDNAKCSRHFTKSDDAFMHPWEGVCWMNPPYGHGIGYWVAKAYDTARAGYTVVCLLPVRTDTVWWQRFVVPHGEVDFIKGRLRFGGAETGAPFPSAVVTFRDALRDGPGHHESHHET